MSRLCGIRDDGRLRRAKRKYAPIILEIATLALVVTVLIAGGCLKVGVEHLVSATRERVNPCDFMKRFPRTLWTLLCHSRRAQVARMVARWQRTSTAFVYSHASKRLQRLAKVRRATSTVRTLEQFLIACCSERFLRNPKHIGITVYVRANLAGHLRLAMLLPIIQLSLLVLEVIYLIAALRGHDQVDLLATVERLGQVIVVFIVIVTLRGRHENYERTDL